MAPKRGVREPKRGYLRGVLEYPRWDLVIEVPNRIYSTQRKWVEVPHRGLKYPKLVVKVLRWEREREVEVPKRRVEVPKRGVEVPKGLEIHTITRSRCEERASFLFWFKHHYNVH